MNMQYYEFINSKYLTEMAAYKIANEKGIPDIKVKGKLKKKLISKYINKYGYNFNAVSGKLLPNETPHPKG